MQWLTVGDQTPVFHRSCRADGQGEFNAVEESPGHYRISSADDGDKALCLAADTETVVGAGFQIRMEECTGRNENQHFILQPL